MQLHCMCTHVQINSCGQDTTASIYHGQLSSMIIINQLLQTHINGRFSSPTHLGIKLLIRICYNCICRQKKKNKSA
jgi:hypothetical protein